MSWGAESETRTTFNYVYLSPVSASARRLVNPRILEKNFNPHVWQSSDDFPRDSAVSQKMTHSFGTEISEAEEGRRTKTKQDDKTN